MTPIGRTRRYGGVGDSRRWLLTAALREHAERRGDAEWLRDSDGDRLSFAQAHEESLRAASFFHEVGVRLGERVGIFAFNGTTFVRAWFGLGTSASLRCSSIPSYAAPSCSTSSPTRAFATSWSTPSYCPMWPRCSRRSIGLRA